MQLGFYKYQGTGNDFIMIDGRNLDLSFLTEENIAQLCDRRFGIGGDGLIVLRLSEGYDFEMLYYNSDGRESSMCGNGGRCIARFAHDLGLPGPNFLFKAIDGDHRARVSEDRVELEMSKVYTVEPMESGSYFMDTGSPHHVVLSEEIPADNFVEVARAIRNNRTYRDEGVNVNFVRLRNGHLEMRTYERGVEDETYSCGTGVTAAALTAFHHGWISGSEVRVVTRGGELSVVFEPNDEPLFQNIWLRGPAEKVFEGRTEI